MSRAHPALPILGLAVAFLTTACRRDREARTTARDGSLLTGDSSEPGALDRQSASGRSGKYANRQIGS